MRSPDSALLTASTEMVRLTPSGAIVSGRTTAPRSGTTGSSLGSGGAWGVSTKEATFHEAFIGPATTKVCHKKQEV